MDLYLLRHGHAPPGHPDRDRPLSPEGAAAVERVAARTAAAGVRLAHVYHSGYRRAEQTAAILARHLNATNQLAPREGLAPNDPIVPIARWLLDPAVFDTQDGLALVGHLPFLDLLAARLVTGREDARVLVLEPATLVKLIPGSDRDGYTIAWVLTPDLA